MKTGSREKRTRVALQETLYAIGLRIQPGLKEFESAVVDHVILRNLSEIEKQGRKPTVKAVSRCLGFNGSLALSHTVSLSALQRLRDAGLVKLQGNLCHPRTVTASLTGEGKELLRDEDRESSQLLSRVFDRLLSRLPGEKGDWKGAFLDCLSSVFSQLGREYAGVLAARKAPEGVVTQRYLESQARNVARQYPSVDAGVLLSVLRRFFEERNNDFSRLIWHLAQMHFALRELGMGFGGAPARVGILDQRTFYLDTNVLFPIAVDGMPRSESLRIFVSTCRDAGASVLVGKPTLDEFSRSLRNQVEQAQKVLSKIPESLAEDLNDPIYYAFDAANQDGDVQLEAVLERFGDPHRVVNAVPGVRVQDDTWFDSVGQSREFRDTVNEIRQVSREFRGQSKLLPLAEHDAKMLLYVMRESSEGRKSTFVTLDSILPRCSIARQEPAPLVAPLDALLQWVCPALTGIADEEALAQVFSAALTARLFPWEEHLHLEHFAILDALELGCFDLPEEDLRDCIRHVEALLHTTDPSTDAGKLALMGEMQRYIAAPGKRYQRELSEERTKREAAEDTLASVRSQTGENVVLRILLSAALIALSVFVADRFAPGSTFWERWISLYGLIALLAGAPWIRALLGAMRREKH